MKPCLFILCLAASFTTFAQREYMMEVDPETGAVYRHSTLYNVNYIAVGVTAVNPAKNYYTFPGLDFNGNTHLFTVDLANRKMLYEPSGWTGNWPLVYNGDKNVLYTVVKGAPDRLMTIDPQTGDTTLIGETFSCTAPRYFFTALDRDNNVIYTGCYSDSIHTIIKTNIDDSGKTFTYYEVGTPLDNGLVFHENSKKLFAFHTENDISTLVEYDLANNTSKALSSTHFYYNSSTINQAKNEIVAIGYTDRANSNTTLKAFTFSVPDGQLKRTVPLDSLDDVHDNLNSIIYNEGDKKYYMLHWDNDTANHILNIPKTSRHSYVTAEPNPFTKHLNLRLKTESSADVQIAIYNAVGAVVYTSSVQAYAGTNVFPVNLGDYRIVAGVYFMRISGLEKPFFVRIVKEE